MNSALRLVPWQSWEEWRYVKDLLYSNDYNSQMEGISIVKAWKCRCKAIPVSVESTSQFTEIMLKMDAIVHNHNIDSNQIQYSELVLSSSMAIIKMVNGIVDSEQKGVYSKSVNVIAEEIGLPREFIDLRHRCTHGMIPSIDVLYASMFDCKKWLFDNYWTVVYFVPITSQKQENYLTKHYDSLIQQLIVVSQLASSNCNPVAFTRKGEVYRILRTVFQNTSHNDFLDVIIPVLTGTSRFPHLNYYPVVLPDFTKPVDRTHWIQNWNRIFVNAASIWECFVDAFIEHALQFIITDNSASQANEWMRALVQSLFNKRFYSMCFQRKLGSGGKCTYEEIVDMKCSPERYVKMLLRATCPAILDFAMLLLDDYMSEADKQLFATRKEMGLLMKQHDEPPKPISVQNARLQELEEQVEKMEKKQPSMLCQSDVLRYEYDDVPIGSILF